MLSILEKNKRILIIIAFIILSPLIIDIISEITNIVLELGRILGSSIRCLI